MLIYQDGKMYIQNKGNLTGVNIYPGGVTLVPDTETKEKGYTLTLTLDEAISKFQVTEEKPYIFPVIKPVIEKLEEVDTNESTPKVKRTPRKSTRK